MKKKAKKAKPAARKPKPALKKKTSTRKPAAVPRAARRDELDGCDVAVTSATLDHELPPSHGGIA